MACAISERTGAIMVSQAAGAQSVADAVDGMRPFYTVVNSVGFTTVADGTITQCTGPDLSAGPCARTTSIRPQFFAPVAAAASFLAGGRITVSITWITPLLALMSAVVTVAPLFSMTLPSFTVIMMG